jgi:hypothetical protein
MKVGDRVVDKLYRPGTPLYRGTGKVVSLSECGEPNCACCGFAQIHWDSEEEPDELGQDYANDLEVIKEG